MIAMQLVKIISKDTIKPSSPTPSHLRNYKLSLLDQLSSRFYIARVLFFTHKDNYGNAQRIDGRSYHRLKKSLSETLTLYYPFAGRLKDGLIPSVDCNDEGVELLQAQVSCQLSVILKQPEPESLHPLFPSGVLGNNSYEGSLVVIQINYFHCGEMAISVCVSHKIADGFTMSNFIQDWAAVARQDADQRVPNPMFISAESSPWVDDKFDRHEIELKKQTCITRRFVFDDSKIAILKAVAAGLGVPNPTRVEVVTALLFERAMAASRAKSRQSMLIQTMNMRAKMVPPLPENSVGNFCWHFSLSLRDEKGDTTTLHELVSLMRKGMSQLYDKYEENFKVKEWFKVVGESMKEAKGLYDNNIVDGDAVNVFSCNSMCRFPLYEVDFGWGKPTWVALAGNVFKNTFVLMDTQRRDGIEAWVTLDEQDMAVLEYDEELLAFSTLNPSVN